jgi:hypothetical protein
LQENVKMKDRKHVTNADWDEEEDPWVNVGSLPSF